MKRHALILITIMFIICLVNVSYAENAEPELKAQDIDFLTKQCQIEQADVDVIPHLYKPMKMEMISRIDRRDCKLFEKFKISRAYFKQMKQLKPKSAIPLAPAGWDISHLTEEEFKQYIEILENAPW